MIALFYILAAVTLVEGVVSLLGGVTFHRFVLRELRRKRAEYFPNVGLIVPCKGLDQGFSENIQALLDQDYPNFKIFFVTTDSNDPAYAALERLVLNSSVPIELVTAGLAKDRGQKVHNLIKAVQRADADIEVFVFADSDGRPHKTWLKDLVAPLAEERVGVSTGYRWYLPRSGFWSLIQSVWNAGIVTLLGDHPRNFAWGGSMAIRRSTFERAHVFEHWDRAVSDDYAMTHAIKKAGYLVRFVPQCLVLTVESCDFRTLLEWAARQIIITKIYWPRLWKLAAISQIVFNLVLFWGVALVSVQLVEGGAFIVPTVLLLTIVALSVGKGTLRFISVRKILKVHAKEITRYGWGYGLLVPVVSWLTLYALLKSATTNRITWRGITYEIRSPNETNIIAPS